MKSARQIGEMIGKTAREVNVFLEESGYHKKSTSVGINGSHGWNLTEKGKQYGKQSDGQWNYNLWDE